MTGFEPAVFCSQSRRIHQVFLHPDTFVLVVLRNTTLSVCPSSTNPSLVLRECQLLDVVSDRNTASPATKLKPTVVHQDHKLDLLPALVVALARRLEVVHPVQLAATLRTLSCVLRGEPTGEADVGASVVPHLHHLHSSLGALDSNQHLLSSEPSVLPIRPAPNAQKDSCGRYSTI